MPALLSSGDYAESGWSRTKSNADGARCYSRAGRSVRETVRSPAVGHIGVAEPRSGHVTTRGRRWMALLASTFVGSASHSGERWRNGRSEFRMGRGLRRWFSRAARGRIWSQVSGIHPSVECAGDRPAASARYVEAASSGGSSAPSRCVPNAHGRSARKVWPSQKSLRLWESRRGRCSGTCNRLFAPLSHSANGTGQRIAAPATRDRSSPTCRVGGLARFGSVRASRTGQTRAIFWYSGNRDKFVTVFKRGAVPKRK